MQIKEDNGKRKGKYSQTCVKRPYKIRRILAFEAGGCLLLHDSGAESSCMSFLHYCHAAISNHLSIAILHAT